jgi:hypothetical protein
VSRRPVHRWIEVVAAAALVVWMLTRANLLALLATGARAGASGVRSMFALLLVDGGTFLPAFASLAKAALLLAPVVRLFIRAPRRLPWAPLAALLFLPVLANSLPAISTVTMWVLLIAASALGFWVARRNWWRALAFLPWLMALEPLTGHSPLADVVWPGGRLVAHCAGNDGRRPADLRAEVAMTRYYGVTAVSPELMLLTGERNSFWARRGAGGEVRLGAPVGPRGNMWQGCAKGGKLWLTARARACAATPPASDRDPGSFTCWDVPGPPEVGTELDYTDTLCSAPGDHVYLGQLVRGGLIELDPTSGSTRWHPVMPGLNLQAVARRDGLLVAINTGRLVVFDPRSDRVEDDQAAGMVAMGLDVCVADDAVVVADLAGRVRLFDWTADKRYRFRSGVRLPAPRRVAFAPSCDRVVVTSGDDRHAWLLRRSDLTVLRTWTLGPGLRDVTFVDDKTVAVADGCTLTVLDASQ